ncbi:hypothetical protein Taro_000423 [Colocasia esculenta]|uniref:Uncharacterized protein n=1 Tax=Colocasia esculenta TaxID=4460 RepID=A0A843T7U1_COLES|nr:hypothetical protein [Colocasia esculenta]
MPTRSGVEYHILAPMSGSQANAPGAPDVTQRLDQLMLRLDQVEQRMESGFTESGRTVQGMAGRLAVLEGLPPNAVADPVHPPAPLYTPRADRAAVRPEAEDDPGFESFDEVDDIPRPVAYPRRRPDRQNDHEWEGDRRPPRFPRGLDTRENGMILAITVLIKGITDIRDIGMFKRILRKVGDPNLSMGIKMIVESFVPTLPHLMDL